MCWHCHFTCSTFILIFLFWSAAGLKTFSFISLSLWLVRECGLAFSVWSALFVTDSIQLRKDHPWNSLSSKYALWVGIQGLLLSTPHSEQPLQRMAHALWEPRDGCQLLQGGGFMSREVFRGGDDVWVESQRIYKSLQEVWRGKTAQHM